MITYEEIIEMGECISVFLITLNKTHDYYINQYIKKTEITPGQYYMLLHLHINPNVTQSDIAKACLMDRCSVSRTFKDFEEKGLIIRTTNPDNKRAYNIKLTQKAKDIVKFLEKKEKEWDEMIAKELKMDSDELITLLKKISLKSLKYNQNEFFNNKN